MLFGGLWWYTGLSKPMVVASQAAELTGDVRTPMDDGRSGTPRLRKDPGGELIPRYPKPIQLICGSYPPSHLICQCRCVWFSVNKAVTICGACINVVQSIANNFIFSVLHSCGLEGSLSWVRISGLPIGPKCRTIICAISVRSKGIKSVHHPCIKPDTCDRYAKVCRDAAVCLETAAFLLCVQHAREWHTCTRKIHKVNIGSW